MFSYDKCFANYVITDVDKQQRASDAFQLLID